MVEATHQLQIFTKYEYKCTTHNTIEARGALPCKAHGDLVIQMSRSSSACIGGKTIDQLSMELVQMKNDNSIF